MIKQHVYAIVRFDIRLNLLRPQASQEPWAMPPPATTLSATSASRRSSILAELGIFSRNPTPAMTMSGPVDAAAAAATEDISTVRGFN